MLTAIRAVMALVLLFVLSLPGADRVKFYPIPTKSAPATRQVLTDLRMANIIPHNIGTFASPEDWIGSTGVFPPQEGTGSKYWRDNATIWSTAEAYDYVYIDGEVDPKSNLPGEGWSDKSFDIYSPSVVTFYRSRPNEFRKIPRLRIRTLSRYEAGRLNFGPAPPADYPIGIIQEDPSGPIPGGKRASFPSSMALRFDPQTGQPQAFLIEDYIRDFPIEQAPSAVPRLSDEELIGSLRMILESPMGTKEKASAIRQIAK